MTAATTFPGIWAAVAGVDGWLTEAQARRLHELAAAVAPGGCIVEIGSYRGRSAIVLASSAAPGVDVVAIDPHAGNDRGPRQIHGTRDAGDDDHARFVANLGAAGVRDRVRHVRLPSQSPDALAAVGAVDLLYIDGAHRMQPALEDIVRWGAKVAPGGTMAIHDSFNAVGVTLAQVRSLVFGRRFRYVGRSGSLSEYARADLRGAARAANAARQLAQLGYFARSAAVKVALAAGRPGVARRLGHRGDAPWPY